MKEHLGWKVSVAILLAVGCIAMTVTKDLGTLILFSPFVALPSEQGESRGKFDLRDWKQILVWILGFVLLLVPLILLDSLVFKTNFLSQFEKLIVSPVGASLFWLGTTASMLSENKGRQMALRSEGKLSSQ